MTTFEKGVKAFAITLAVIIIVSIVSTLLGVLNFTGRIIDGTHHDSYSKEEYYPETGKNDNSPSNGDYEKKRISKLEIDLKSTGLEMYEGEEFKVEKYDTDNRVYFENINGTLKIKETSHHFWSSTGGTVVIYVPRDSSLNKIDIEMGAGKATFKNLDVDVFELEQGAGSISIEDCTFNSSEIDGGAGRMTIKNSNLNNLELDSGVGSVEIEARMTGTNKIDAGVGSLKIRLLGNREDYSISAKKGIGSLRIDGEKDLNSFGTGPNYIKVEGGTGSIQIDFED